jgi:hypothetical protein
VAVRSSPEPIRDAFHGERLVARSRSSGRAGVRPRRGSRARGRGRPRVRGGHDAESAGSWIEECLAAEPSRAEPWLLRGLTRIGWAWQARGSGLASDVAEDAWPVFFERLRLAEGDLQEAIARDASDALPWAYLSITGRGLDVGVDELRRRWEEGRKRSPDPPPGCWSAQLSGPARRADVRVRARGRAAAPGGQRPARSSPRPTSSAGSIRWNPRRQADCVLSPEVLDESARWARGPGSACLRAASAPNHERCSRRVHAGLTTPAHGPLDQLNRGTTTCGAALGEPMEASGRAAPGLMHERRARRARFPPILQPVGVGLLGLFVLLAAGRVSPRLALADLDSAAWAIGSSIMAPRCCWWRDRGRRRELNPPPR